MRETVLAIDAGGTSVKTALMSGHGAPIAGTERLYAFDGDDRERLLQTFREAARDAGEFARALGLRVTRAGAACPGPFDFRRGVSLMTHKWRGLYGVPLAPVLREAFPYAQVAFLHDSTAFMLGEAFSGAGRAAVNPSGVMLGTGFGYAQMRGRRVLLDGTLSPIVRLWREEFEGGTVEDAVSRRAIRARYMKHAPASEHPPDVSDIAALARSGDRAAIDAFAETGRLLGRVLRRYLPEYCDLVIVGGRIALSEGLFLPCARGELNVPIVPATHIKDAALYGVCQYLTHDPTETTQEVRT